VNDPRQSATRTTIAGTALTNKPIPTGALCVKRREQITGELREEDDREPARSYG